MRVQPSRRWLTAAVVLAVGAATAAADDRDFLRERAAKPNILILLDTSTSMIGTSEVADEFREGQGPANVDFGMLPGGGDDPRSRMGIAKAVLRGFLQNVTDANFALAGYQYELPKDSGDVINPFPAKHWNYQPLTGDRFGFLDPSYVYRVGWAERTFNSPTVATPHTNPADYSRSVMLGYNPYFDPDSASANYVEPWLRYGPVLPPDIERGNPYSLLPIYLMRNCETEDIGGDGRDCGLRVFPFFTAKDLLGNTVLHQWTSSFANCDPSTAPDAGGTDDGCRSGWTVDNGDNSITQWVRRAHINVPSTVSGAANHPLGEDTGGAMSGNREVTDVGGDDYTLDGTDDADLDGSDSLDWLMRVELVEQRKSRVCAQPQPTFTFTPTFTPTNTPTNTPTFTPTPLPPPACSDIFVGSLFYLDENRVRIDVVQNNSPFHQLIHKRTDIEWEDLYPSQYLNFMNFNDILVYYPGDDPAPPTTAVVDVTFNPGQQTMFTTRWDGFNSPTEYIAGTTTVTFSFEYPYSGLTCTVTRTADRVPPTPTPTATPLPPAYCSDINVSGLAPTLSGAYSTWGLYQASVVNGTGVAIEIQRTDFTWFQLRGNWLVDWYALNASMADPPDSSWYWGGPNGAAPNDSTTPSSQATTNPSGARLTAGETRAWTADIDGSGASGTDMTYGDWGLCLEFVTTSGVPFEDSGATCVKCDDYLGDPTPTPEPTRTPSLTPTITPTFTPSLTPTITPTFTPSLTPTITPTNTPSLTPSITPTFTRTFTPSNTATPTRTFTPSNTPTRTATPTRTPTPSRTPTSTHTFTPTNTPTFTPTYTPSNTPTFTPTNTPTFTPTMTPSNTPTPTPSPTIPL